MAIISAAIEANGWVLAVRGDWPATAGAWEFGGDDRVQGRFLSGGLDQFPLDADGVAKIVLEVRSAGFDREGGEAVPKAVGRRRLGKTARCHGPLEGPLEGLGIEEVPTDHASTGISRTTVLGKHPEPRPRGPRSRVFAIQGIREPDTCGFHTSSSQARRASPSWPRRASSRLPGSISTRSLSPFPERTMIER